MARGIISVMLVGALCMGVYAGFEKAKTLNLFSVVTFDVEGARPEVVAEINAALDTLRGTSIFRFPNALAVSAVAQLPWVREVHVSRKFPNAVSVRIVEHKAHAVVQLGSLYLANERGRIFKRAKMHEAAGLPVVTGINRLDYLNGRKQAKAQLELALSTVKYYRSHEGLPALSEIEVGRDTGDVTVFLREGGAAIRLGHVIRQGREVTRNRLRRFDAIWTALGPESKRVKEIFLDYEARRDRVVVRMGS